MTWASGTRAEAPAWQLGCVGGPARADELAGCGEALPALRIAGDIDAPMADAIRRLRDTLLADPRGAARIARADIALEVTVDSAGGEVTAALAIGEAFRAMSARVTVPAEARCASSCVFLLAGAVDRAVAGRVLIHRPYFTALAPTPTHAPVRARIAEIDRQILGFLEEMDIARSLLDEMKAVPPEALRPLSERELAYFRLSFEDAAQQERRIAQAAWQAGITSAELRNREVLARRTCQSEAPAAADCASAIRYGLSVEEYAQRESAARAACRDHAEACRREIMLAR